MSSECSRIGAARASPVRPVPVWRPVRGGNAFEITVARLAQAIKLGLVREGDRLPPERELAERLQVSRVTLREAIRALREAGFLESRRGRTGGTFVLANARSVQTSVPRRRSAPEPAPSGPQERAPRPGRAGGYGRGPRQRRQRAPDRDGRAGPVDGRHAARRAGLPAGGRARRGRAGRHPQPRRGRPGSTWSTCLAATRERDPAIRRVADSRLHLAIAAASGSPSLASSVADVQLTLDRLLAAIPVLRRNLDHSDAQHTRIVDAILAGDSRLARAAMEEHCDGTAELLRGLLA